MELQWMDLSQHLLRQRGILLTLKQQLFKWEKHLKAARDLMGVLQVNQTA